jgi:hypothetical protein
LIDEVANAGTLSPDALVPALTAGLRARLDGDDGGADASASRHLVEATAAAVASDTTRRRPHLRRALQEVLAEAGTPGAASPSPRARLAAVDALTAVGPPAVETPSESGGGNDDARR